MIIRKLFTLLGFKTDKKGFLEADKSLKQIKRTAVQVAGILIAGKVVKGIFDIATSTAALANNLDTVALKLGVTVAALQELRFAADQAGISQKTFDSEFQKFSLRARQAATGAGSAAGAFRLLGVRFRDNNGNMRTTDDLLEQVADGLTRVRSRVDRSRVAFRLFGTSGAQFVKFLKDGKGGLRALREEAQLLGGVIDEELIVVSNEFNTSQSKLKFAIRGVKNVIAKELLPFMTRATQRTLAWVKANAALIRSNIVRFIARMAVAGRRLLRFMNRVIDAFNELPKASKLFLGVALAVGVLTAILSSPVGLMLLFIALVALIIEDFETWQDGGDSLFGRIAFWLENLTGLWAVLRDAGALWFKLLKFQFDTVINLLGTFGEFILRLFGGDIPGAFTTLGQQLRQVFEDTFEFIEKLVEGNKVLSFLFNLLTGGARGRFLAGEFIQRLTGATGQVVQAGALAPRIAARGVATVAGSLAQTTSNVFNVAGENAEVIAGKIAEKIDGVNKGNMRRAAETFKRRAGVAVEAAGF